MKPNGFWKQRASELRDGDIAKLALKYGVSKQIIYLARFQCGVSIKGKVGRGWATDWSKVDWSKSNAEIARELNVSREIVRVRRHKVGTTSLTGKRRSDAVVAKRFNVSDETIRRRRVAKGYIASRPVKKWTAEADALLGTDSDKNIAFVLGVSSMAVRIRRHRLKIPSVISRGRPRNL